MTTEEAQKVLNELNNVRSELLNDEAKRLFEAIMSIVNERDSYKSMLEEKDKQIDLMAEKFADIDFDEMCLDCGCCIGNGCVREDRDLYKDCIKEYFYKKVEDKR